jgi:hypothetical protein
MLKFRIALFAVACMALFVACTFAADLKEPGELMSVQKPGDYKAAVGDLLIVSMESNGSLGPANPAANLEVKTDGESVKKVAVVLHRPAKPMPGAPSTIEAYLLCEKTGDCSITITPVKGDKKPGKALEFKVKVAEKRE